MKKPVYGFLLGLFNGASMIALMVGVAQGSFILIISGVVGILAGITLDKKGREHYG